MKKIIYHGSEKIIKLPQYGIGKTYNDYGRCFYTTESREMASEWAVDKNRNGYINEYELDCSGLKVLNLTSEEYSIMNWMAILVANRRFDVQSDFGREAINYLKEEFMPDLAEYDVIEGYRADDSYFSFAQDFLNNIISVKTLSRAMQLGKLGMQIAIKSKKAFEQLEFVKYESVLAEKWYPLKQNRDDSARNAYKNMRNESWQRGEIYMMQILDQEMKTDDVRLRSDIII